MREVYTQKCPLSYYVDTNALQLSLCGSASVGKMCTVEYWSTPQQSHPLRVQSDRVRCFLQCSCNVRSCRSMSTSQLFQPPPHYKTSTIWYCWAALANKHVHCTGAVPHYIRTYVHDKLPPHQLSLTHREHRASHPPPLMLGIAKTPPMCCMKMTRDVLK